MNKWFGGGPPGAAGGIRTRDHRLTRPALAAPAQGSAGLSYGGPAGDGQEQIKPYIGAPAEGALAAAGLRSFARLSAEHPTLPLGELLAVLESRGAAARAVLHLDGLALLDVDPAALARFAGLASMVKEVGALLGVLEPESLDLDQVAEAARSMAAGPVRVDVDVVKGLDGGLDAQRLERELVNALAGRGVAVSPRAASAVKAYVTDDVVVVGLVTAVYKRSALRLSSRSKPYRHSGELNPVMSRALVNLARTREGSVFLDPFCGTGSVAIEAHAVGASRVLCFDVDSREVLGASRNLGQRGVPAAVVREDSTRLPLRDCSVDSIATDPPYGRSTVATGSYADLVARFLEEAARVLRAGGYVAYAGPAEERPHRLARAAGLEVVEVYDQYVHGSLTRQVVVAKKPWGR